ncbi:phage tail tape measure protein [Terrarubrum flagellatum]|uniref:phage tail tape measure protein n=1 Tax=Terrirubrum flagellatum TaxID=2895980 RepID=UPI003144F1C0
MTAKTAEVTVRLIDDVTGPAARMEKALLGAGKSAKEITKAMESGLSPKMANDLAKLGVSSESIKKVVTQFKDYTSTAKLAGTATDWTKADLTKIRVWETGMISSLRRVAREEAALAAKRREVPKAPVDRSHGFVGSLAGQYNVGHAAAGALGVHGVARGAEKIVHTYKEFDDLRRYQKAILGLSDAEQKPFIDQAIRMGATTRFNDLQVIEAQTSLAQRGVKKDFIRPFVGEAANYASAMNTTLDEAAKTLEGIIFGTGKHIEDANEAMATMRRIVDQSVKLAKIGGLDDEDIKQYFKLGGMPGSGAGLSDETLGALGALMRRSNIRGDEAGTAVRTMAGKLVSPTGKGIMALNAMGIDYSKFTRMPGGMSADNFEGAYRQKFGKAISPDARAKIQEAMADPEKVGDRSEFISAVTEALSNDFAKTKKGEMSAVDRKAIARVAEQFHRMSVESVDSEGLLRAISEANPTLAQLNAFFTDKQGGRARAALRDPKLLQDYVNQLRGAPEGFAAKIAEERMGGFAGALARAEGSILNFQTAVGRANDEWMTGAVSKFASFTQHVAELDAGTIRFGTYLAGAGAAALAFAGTLGTARVMATIGTFTGAPGAAGLLGFLNRVPSMAAIGGFLLRRSPWILGAGAAYEYGPDAARNALGTDQEGAVSRGRVRDEMGAVSGNAEIERLRRRRELIDSLRRQEGTPESKRKVLIDWDAANPAGGQFDPLKNFDGKASGAKAGQEVGQGLNEGLTSAGAVAVATAQTIMAQLTQAFAAGINVPIRPQVKGLDSSVNGIHADAGIGH